MLSFRRKKYVLRKKSIQVAQISVLRFQALGFCLAGTFGTPSFRSGFPPKQVVKENLTVERCEAFGPKGNL